MKLAMRVILIAFICLNVCFSQVKTTIAVYNLRSTSILSQEEVEILTNHLRSILINYNKYDCLDRNRMDEILKEQGFQQSDCTNEMCAVEAGQLLGVQKMLSGSVGKFGKLYTIELQVIDIETARIEKSSTYYYEGEMEQLLTEGIKLSLEKLIGFETEIVSNNEDLIESSTESKKISEEPKYGYITFKIVPNDANIKIDNRKVSSQNYENYEISAGTYDLQISRKGYKKYIDVITVESGVKQIIEKSLEIEVKPEKVKHDYSSASLYLNVGFIEPWGDPGTGAIFDMGTRFQGGLQLSISNIFNLPTIFKPLSAEIMVGYASFDAKDNIIGSYYEDGKTNLISFLTLGRYDLSDLILKSIGISNPSLGIFGVAGLQYNNQSWDFPNWNREFDSASSFGLNLGLGIKFNLYNIISMPVEVDLRFTQGVFIMGNVEDQEGNPFFTYGYYNHTENGLLFGIKYSF